MPSVAASQTTSAICSAVEPLALRVEDRDAQIVEVGQRRALALGLARVGRRVAQRAGREAQLDLAGGPAHAPEPDALKAERHEVGDLVGVEAEPTQALGIEAHDQLLVALVEGARDRVVAAGVGVVGVLSWAATGAVSVIQAIAAAV